MNETKDIFWNVKDVAKYENFFETGIKENDQFHRTYELVKNLSYNMQYLEFISNVLKREIHTVINTELIKTFVITGMSVIESILYYAIKSKNLHKTDPFEEIAVFNSNEKKINGVIVKVETRLLKKLKENKEVEMNLNSMLQKTEKNKLLGDDHSIYRKLNHLRKLRNKIHLYLIEENLANDYNIDKALEWIYGEDLTPNKKKSWTKRIKTKAMQRMIGEELEKLLEERNLGKAGTLDLLEDLLKLAKSEKKYSILLELLTKLQRMNGIEEPHKQTTTAILTQTTQRSTIDEIRKEERKLEIRNESHELPEKAETGQEEAVEVQEDPEEVEQKEEAKEV